MNPNDYNNYFPTWCPGCGNYGIWASLKTTIGKLGWKPDEFSIVHDIGCSGNMNDFVKCYGLHALHGRSIASAVGIKLANHSLPVIVVGGDGGLIGEGGNHFLHACRGNFDITVMIHNNQVYGLTTGQVSPTSEKGSKSKSTPGGIIEQPANPLALAITQGATFVGQGFSGDIPNLVETMTQAINHKGFSVVNVYQPCVTFNKLNTYAWFRERVYKLGSEHDVSSISSTVSLTISHEKIPLGILYKSERPTYEESLPQLAAGPLISRDLSGDISGSLSEFE